MRGNLNRWAKRPAAWALTVLIVVSILGRDAGAETWAEKLGYPPGKRLVIMYCAQMGLCHEANQAGQAYLAAGLAQSAGAMVPCPWFADFAQWQRQHPDLDIGLSLTMNSEWKHYRWGPVAPRNEVSRLVDADGFLTGSVLQFTFNATPEQAEREIRAQLRRAERAGIRPGHLAPHLGALFSRPDLMAVYLDAARKLWIPALVVELTPDLIQRFRDQGVPLEDETVRLIADYPLPKVDDLHFTPTAETYEEKRDRFIQLIRGLSPGITQIVLQPAVESDALKRITPDWQQRVWDAQLLSDPEIQKVLQDEGILFTNWKEMMRRFDPATLPGELPPS